jgi:hypothetical protein
LELRGLPAKVNREEHAKHPNDHSQRRGVYRQLPEDPHMGDLMCESADERRHDDERGRDQSRNKLRNAQVLRHMEQKDDPAIDVGW